MSRARRPRSRAVRKGRTGFLGAVAFLTRVPVHDGARSDRDLADGVPWFPVIGFLVGLATAAVYAALFPLFTPLLAAIVAVGGQVLLTGAFHEDGAADLCDAAGGRTREDRLRILRDPVHGTYGVLAVVIVTLLRVAGVSALDGWQALVALPAAHALGRGAAVGLMGIVEPAQGDGLGHGYVRALRPGQVVAGVVAAAVLGAVALGPWAPAAWMVAAIAAALVGRYARRTLGGITGDVLGAAEQAAEVAVLLLVVAVATNGAAALPWFAGV